MTEKEDFRVWTVNIFGVPTDVVKLSDLDKFLESNVCIAKGANRHPYADVLHALVEDSTLKYEVSQLIIIETLQE
jgi:hypothetical protein